MMNMWGFIQLLIVIILCWFLIFSLVDRICKCLEFRASVKGGADSFKKFMDKYINTRDENN